MRVTFNTFPDTLLGRLQSLGSEQNKALTQLSTGQRISAPSDDAPAMQRILNLRTEKKQNQQFHRNATDGLERSKVTFSTLEQLKDLLVRSSELAANLSGASSDQEYKAKAAEIDQLIQQGVNLGNTKLRGSYLFSGESTEVLPFQMETENGKIKSVAYNGSSTEAKIHIGEGESMAIAVSATAQENGDVAGILNEMIRLRDAMSVYSYEEVNKIRTGFSAVSSFQDNSTVTISFAQPFDDPTDPTDPVYPLPSTHGFRLPPNHGLVNGDKIRITLDDMVDNEGAGEDGIKFANGDYFIRNIDSHGYAELSSTIDGPAIVFYVPIMDGHEITKSKVQYPSDKILIPNTNDLKVGNKIQVNFAEGEEGDLSSGEYFVASINGEFLQLSKTLGGAPVIFKNEVTSDSTYQRVGGLQHMEDAVLSALSRQGTIQYRLETAMRDLEVRYESSEKLISTDADVDFAEATVRLNRSQMAYQAAIQSGAKIQNNSLLDYLR